MVIEIESNSDPSDWHHYKGRENPTDHVSREANLETIKNSQIWMHGPQCLRTKENTWPKNLNCDFSSIDTCEYGEQVFTFACESELNTTSVINLTKYSSVQKLLRCTGWVLRFVHNIRNRLNKRCNELTAEEIDGAENFWIRLVQKDDFAEEVNCLLKSVQVTAPLPAIRVEQSAPFSVVGIDFGGPLYTKDENKHYIVLFTCGVTRALHLEFMNNLTAETFLLVLRRFISRGGLCSKILTDNAKTFNRSELELENLWKVISDPAVKAFYASHKIRWQFIIEGAAWWGGFYERLIRTVKLAL
ncbi:integrase catalytic domain-containing protein [Trichonephila clavata]|uniref:Integrase catalytic domain-containing protein n=1 Tax=Trichonephila clavata TaxID=2740835 RepID=A0A8X6KKC2_TRICU|nr:integrase catalytic domain-containing protein [Trichonephila clavata]